MSTKLGMRVLEERLINYQIQNFGPIGALTIDFTDTPIVMLKGKNESGKSNAARALATLMYNTRQNSQKLLINDNAGTFKVTANFEGYQIEREKGRDDNKNINSYTLFFDPEFIAQHPDLGLEDFYMANIGASAEPPAPIADLLNMGYDKDTGEEFSYRRNGNMLLLTTLDSANHKIVYNGLEASEIRAALKLAGEEAKKSKDNFTKTATIRGHLQKEISDTIVPDISRLEKLYEEINVININRGKLSEVLSVLRGYSAVKLELDTLKESVESIDYSVFIELEKVIENLQSYSKVSKELKNLEGSATAIDLENLTLLTNTSSKLTDYLDTRKRLDSIPELMSLTENDIMQVEEIRKVFGLLKEYANISRELKEVDKGLSDLQLTAKDFAEHYKICTRCGELIPLNSEEGCENG